MKTIRYFTFFMAMLLLSAPALQAQVYPVTLVAQSNPPHTGNLAELAAPGFNRLGVSMILNDRNELSYQVRLVVEIEGQGIKLQTRADFQPRPITLSYGIPVQVRGADLSEYLDINNLDFQGISKQQYLQQGSLPDGLYSVCFTVHAYGRTDESAASARSCTGIVAVRHDPPVILAPIGFQSPIFPQNLAVQWQPRHVAGFPVQYTLQIFEFDPNNQLTPDLIVQYTQPFLEKTINTVTAAFISPADPQLELGGRYLVRVRAQDITMQNSFHNDGWSAPEFFTYGEACRAPDNIAVETQNESSIRVEWSPRPGFNRYVVRYRERDTPGANWYEDETLLTTHNLENLIDATAYEIQVQTLCNGDYQGPFSNSYYAVTDSLEIVDFDCTDPATFPLPANTRPIAALQYGDVVTVGGFQMRITEVTASEETPGGWDGTGQIRINWMAGKRFICKFEGLMVNTDKQVFDGEVYAFTKGLESIPDWKSPEQILEELAEMPVENMTTICGTDSTAVSTGTPAGIGAGASTPAGTTTATPPSDSIAPAFIPYPDTSVYANPFATYEPDSLPFNAGLNAGANTLPFILGGYPNAIVIDNIVFRPQGATLNAYFTAGLPGTSGNTPDSTAASTPVTVPDSTSTAVAADSTAAEEPANRYVAFQSIDVAFHPGGLLGEARMQLMTNHSAKWSSKIRLSILQSPNSYVSWDCNGLRGISIDGKVEFCPSLLVALHPDSLTVAPDDFVTGTFVAAMPKWGQFVADMSITPFEIPRLRDWGWEVQNMVFDFSDEMTPASVVFPDGYSHADVNPDSLAGDLNPRWTGFYLRTARVKVPERFYGSRGAPVQVVASDLIIDQTGFTGNVTGINVLSRERGRVGTWEFSLDTLQIGIQQNQFHHVGFVGTTKVPSFENAFRYTCLIQPDSAYRFSVGIGEDTMRLSAWKADVELYENTRIELDYDVSEREFSARAYLYGMASMKPTVGRAARPTDTLEVASLQFQDFIVSTAPPYLVNIGSWEYSSGNQQFLSKFPLSIRSFSLTQGEEPIIGADSIPRTPLALSIGAAVNLMGTSDRGFAAEGTASILFSVYLDTVQRKQIWRYEGVRVDSFAINASGAAYQLVGKLRFYEQDEVYGSGFRAMLTATFTPRLTVSAVAQFGTKNTFRYWFADALVSFNPGIALGTTGLSLYGFGGGASYKVARERFANIVLPDSTGMSVPANMDNQIGRSLSGTIYVPDSTAGLGIKAMVALGTARREVFNGSLTFEIIFNSSWGVRSIGFIGDGRFLTPPPTPGQPGPEPSLRCILDMSYDFEHEAFHATLDLYVNHMNVVKGAYPQNLAGRGVIHVDPNDWYIHLGTPQRRVMFSYSLAGLSNLARPNPGNTPPPDSSGLQIDWANAGLLLTVYLDAGTILPPFPDIPQRVQSILGGGNFSIVSRDDPRFASGGGVMFGASVELSIPDLSFLMFYASFGAGAGFDVMLRDYGLDARCAGNETSNSPIGINGWYATGQLWGYIEGSVGIKVNLFTVKGRYEILSLAVAAILQTRLPNPLWARGIVGGRFRILSGLVSGNCRFEFEFGKKCDIVGGSELAGIEVIASTKPDGNTATDVDVFARPQATFNLAMGEVFELQDDAGNYWQYRAKIHEFGLLKMTEDDEDGEAVAGEIRWNAASDVVGFKPDDVLDGNSPYRLVVRVRFDKKGRYEQEWRELKKLSGKSEEQEAIVNFTTGPAPDYIPASNIAFSYPVRDQFNYLKQESGQGYIQLKQGQAYLFKGHPNWSYASEAGIWEQKLRIMNGNQQVHIANFSYNNSTRRISFTMPTGATTLPNNAILSLSLTTMPLVNDDSLNANIQTIRSELVNLQTSPADTAFTNIMLEERVAATVQRGRQPKNFYASHFRTSLYNTFPQKMNALNMSQSWLNPVFLDPNVTSGASINDFGVFVTGNELFDLFDQTGYDNGDTTLAPLVQPIADLSVTGGNWYNNSVYPYMYQHFPAAAQDITLSWRNTAILGNVPAKAVSIYQLDTPHRLTEEDVQTRTAIIPQPVTGLAYQVPFNALFDSFDYKHKVLNFMASNPNTALPAAWINFVQGNMQYPPFGTYRVKLEYRLPGINTLTSQHTLNLIYGTSN